MTFRESLTYDDVLLVPQYSDVVSRTNVDVFVKMGDYVFTNPLIPANMKTITELAMAEAVIKSGGLAILHRFISVERQVEIAEMLMIRYGNNNLALSVGVQQNDYTNIKTFYNCGIRILCIDIAHAHSKSCIEMIKHIKNTYPNIFLIAGNVATGEGAAALWKAGADCVKVGIGASGICSTRINTGAGVPQLTAIMDVAKMKKDLSLGRPLYTISDGGAKTYGDVVKALCFADMVMTGNLFAGCQECPGQEIIINNQRYKEYSGSSTYKKDHIEGVEAMVLSKGTYHSVLTKMLQAIKSGCSYQGAHNLTQLKENPQFIKTTHAGLIESNIHDVKLKGE